MYDYDVVLSFITALTLTYFAIPSIISVAKIKNLVDVPGGRHVHEEVTPSLGGIGIFAGVIFSILLWTPFIEYGGNLQFILCSFVIIFLIGVRDDILPMSAGKKLIGQLLAATILVFKADIQISGLYGIFGIEELPYGLCAIISLFIIIVIINGFNLIDGINGLSGSISTLICLILGIWFLMIHRYDLAILASATAGAVVAFLKYNYTPAKIFMGDTGALLVGLVCSILVISFIDLNHNLEKENFWKINAGPAVGFGILIFPLFDTLRVFTMRIIRGRSPFSPDRNHIHHLLIDYGLSHMQATFTVVLVNVFFIVFVFLLQPYLIALELLAIILGVAMVLTGTLHYYVYKKRLKKRSQKQN